MDLNEIWPPYQLRIAVGDLELKIVRDNDLAELVDLALEGVHDPEFMPFSTPWTDADPAELPANLVRHHWSSRGQFTPEAFTLNLAVRRGGELVGTQALSTENFPVARTGETGSWLARRFHGQGLGTAMRRAICTLAFDELGAHQVTSGAFIDNPSSLAVSRKVGYQPNGIQRLVRRGEPAVNQKLLLTPQEFIRGDTPITITGAAPLRRFLHLADPHATPGPAG